MSASLKASPGRQPSITQPMAGPWDSPKLVTAKRCPNVLPLMTTIIGQAAGRFHPVAGLLIGGLLGICRPVTNVGLQHFVLEVLTVHQALATSYRLITPINMRESITGM